MVGTRRSKCQEEGDTDSGVTTRRSSRTARKDPVLDGVATRRRTRRDSESSFASTVSHRSSPGGTVLDVIDLTEDEPVATRTRRTRNNSESSAASTSSRYSVSPTRRSTRRRSQAAPAQSVSGVTTRRRTRNNSESSQQSTSSVQHVEEATSTVSTRRRSTRNNGSSSEVSNTLQLSPTPSEDAVPPVTTRRRSTRNTKQQSAENTILHRSPSPALSQTSSVQSITPPKTRKRNDSGNSEGTSTRRRSTRRSGLAADIADLPSIPRKKLRQSILGEDFMTLENVPELPEKVEEVPEEVDVESISSIEDTSRNDGNVTVIHIDDIPEDTEAESNDITVVSADTAENNVVAISNSDDNLPTKSAETQIQGSPQKIKQEEDFKTLENVPEVHEKKKVSEEIDVESKSPIEDTSGNDGCVTGTHIDGIPENCKTESGDVRVDSVDTTENKLAAVCNSDDQQSTKSVETEIQRSPQKVTQEEAFKTLANVPEVHEKNEDASEEMDVESTSVTHINDAPENCETESGDVTVDRVDTTENKPATVCNSDGQHPTKSVETQIQGSPQKVAEEEDFQTLENVPEVHEKNEDISEEMDVESTSVTHINDTPENRETESGDVTADSVDTTENKLAAVCNSDGQHPTESVETQIQGSPKKVTEEDFKTSDNTPGVHENREQVSEEMNIESTSSTAGNDDCVTVAHINDIPEDSQTESGDVTVVDTDTSDNKLPAVSNFDDQQPKKSVGTQIQGSPQKVEEERDLKALENVPAVPEKAEEVPEEMDVESTSPIEDASGNDCVNVAHINNIPEDSQTESTNVTVESAENELKPVSTVVNDIPSKSATESGIAAKKLDSVNGHHQPKSVIPKPIQGKNKSGRFWKSERKKFSSIVRKNGSHVPWQQRMELKKDLKYVKEQEAALRQEKEAMIQEMRKKKAEKKQRRKENARRSEVVQVITNPAKLKKARRKNLRNIEMRDLTAGGLSKKV